MSAKRLRELVLDTETTGLKISDGHRIISIGCVELINRCRTGRVIHIYVNPGRHSDKEALAVHGITSEFLQDKPTFAEVAQEFCDFIAEDTLVIHNARFDVGFLNHELQRVGRPLIKDSRVIDTLIQARKRYPGSPASLDALCKKFNIDTSIRIKHGALIDADLLASVYIAMNGVVQTTIGFANPEESHKHRATPAVRYPPRFFQTTPEEERLHSQAVSQKVKEPIWSQYISQSLALHGTHTDNR